MAGPDVKPQTSEYVPLADRKAPPGSLMVTREPGESNEDFVDRMSLSACLDRTEAKYIVLTLTEGGIIRTWETELARARFSPDVLEARIAQYHKTAEALVAKANSLQGILDQLHPAQGIEVSPVPPGAPKRKNYLR